MEVKIISEFGHSMVEMLGVLAIVGVLSVGGMIGFNQAMIKIRTQKAATELILWFHDLYTVREQLVNLNPKPKSNFTLVDTLFNMKQFPEGWSYGTKINNNQTVVDSLGNSLHPYVRGGTTRIAIDYYLKEKKERCQI